MASTEKNTEQIELARKLNHTPWCDDYEKMISGMLYNSLVPELAAGRFRARKLMHRFNNEFPDDATVESLDKSRSELLKQMFGSVGEGAFIEPPMFIDYGSQTTIGKSFFANFNLTILDCALVTIGDRCMFGPNVSIYAATHETEVQSRRDYIEYARPVSIGNDCWIGGNVTIMPGVTIGKGCTVGSGSIVTKDIPDFSIAIGAPAKVVKKVQPIPDVDS